MFEKPSELLHIVLLTCFLNLWKLGNMYVYGLNYKIEMNFSDLFFCNGWQKERYSSLSLSHSLSPRCKLNHYEFCSIIVWYFLTPINHTILNVISFTRAPVKLSGKLLFDIITCVKIKKYFGMIQYFLKFYFHSLWRIKKFEQVFLLTLFLFFN